MHRWWRRRWRRRTLHKLAEAENRHGVKEFEVLGSIRFDLFLDLLLSLVGLRRWWPSLLATTCDFPLGLQKQRFNFINRALLG